ncbi:MAG TPA: hypothetical protein VGL22_17375 [Terracidiphilus sp.]|jgi:hypothetical protein
MISDKDVARQISDLMLDAFNRIEDSCELVSRSVPQQEAAAYSQAADRIIQPIVLDLLEPLFARHPDLKPAHWDDDPAEEPSM